MVGAGSKAVVPETGRRRHGRVGANRPRGLEVGGDCVPVDRSCPRTFQAVVQERLLGAPLRNTLPHRPRSLPVALRQ